jgi:glycosyltransferase involved in cell wall biosynthesis
MRDVVIVHDFLGQVGGAERVVEEMCLVYPDAPLYTSYYAPSRTYPFFRSKEVRTSFLDRAPGIYEHHRAYLPLYPVAFSTMRLPECRVVLSSSTSFAKGARIPRGALHVCYCNTPMRFAWDFERYVADDTRVGGFARAAARAAIRPLRRWDLRTNDKVDLFVANSENIRDRIRRLYGRESLVVYPPVDVERFAPVSTPDDFYLVVSRLVGYKRVDLAVEACSRTDRPLVVVGDGPERAALEAVAGPTVEFRGALPEREMCETMARCRALLFCGEEDFGITPVEAMAAGRPVLAYGAGGALETVVDGVTGLFFDRQDCGSMVECLERFEAAAFAADECVRRAQEFARPVFRRRLTEAVASVLGTTETDGDRRKAV